MIRVSVDRALDVTVFTVIGPAVTQEVTDTIRDAFQANPTANAIWDLSNASVSNLTVDSFYAIHRQAEESAKLRKNPRTIIVSDTPSTQAIIRLLKAVSDHMNSSVKLDMAETLDHARKMLRSDGYP